jgi:hypothetical protein
MAIAALVCAILLPPLGLVLGLVAQRQIRRTHEGGAGLAKAAVILGLVLFVIPVVIGVVAVAILIVTDAQDQQERQAPTTITSTIVVPSPTS